MRFTKSTAFRLLECADRVAAAEKNEVNLMQGTGLCKTVSDDFHVRTETERAGVVESGLPIPLLACSDHDWTSFTRHFPTFRYTCVPGRASTVTDTFRLVASREAA